MYLLIGLLLAVFPVIGYFFAGKKGLGYGFIIGVIFAVCTGTFYFVGADIVGLVIGVFVAASMMGKETRDISPFRAILSNLKNRLKRPVVPKQIPVPEEK